jgi:hypothetical protein
MPRAIRANLPSYIPAANFALAVLSAAAGGAPANASDVHGNIGATLAKSPQLKSVILQALASGEDDLKAAQKFLENWYDSAMDRVSGWYKRRAQIMLFCIGLFAAVVLNVDTITVARSLIGDTALRQAVVNHAAELKGATEADFETSKKDLLSIGYPIGWTNLPQLPRDSADKKTCAPSDCVSQLFASGSIAIQTLPPMILGWLITALAITLGAPFWFDLLGKFMQVRSTGKAQSAAAPDRGPAAQTPSSTVKADSAGSGAGLGALDQLALAPVIAAGQAAFVAEQWADGSDRGAL